MGDIEYRLEFCSDGSGGEYRISAGVSFFGVCSSFARPVFGVNYGLIAILAHPFFLFFFFRQSEKHDVEYLAINISSQVFNALLWEGGKPDAQTKRSGTVPPSLDGLANTKVTDKQYLSRDHVRS